MKSMNGKSSIWQELIWLELGCWTVLLLAPVYYLVNGPSVSPPQLTMRIVMVAVAATGAAGLRLARRRLAGAPPTLRTHEDSTAAEETIEP